MLGDPDLGDFGVRVWSRVAKSLLIRIPSKVHDQGPAQPPPPGAYRVQPRGDPDPYPVLHKGLGDPFGPFWTIWIPSDPDRTTWDRIASKTKSSKS